MRKLSAALFLSVFVLTLQGHAKDPAFSAQLLQARYAALGYETANGFLGEWETESFISAKILPEDRQALAISEGSWVARAVWSERSTW